MLRSITGAARHAGRLGAVLLTSAVISGLVVATGGLLDRHAVEGVRAEFATRSGDERALRLSLPLAGDADAQDAGVRSALDLDFARVDAPIAIDRVVEGRVELSSGDGRASVIAEALSIEGFPDRASLVAGDWAGADGLTMQADAAEALSLEPGAVVEVSGERFTLTGTWRITDRLDPRWTDPRLMAEGSAGDRAAVVVLDESSWARLAAEQEDSRGGAHQPVQLRPRLHRRRRGGARAPQHDHCVGDRAAAVPRAERVDVQHGGARASARVMG